MNSNSEDYTPVEEPPFFNGIGYKPAPVEAYNVDNGQEMGLTPITPNLSKTCHLWNDAGSTPYFLQLQDYIVGIKKNYYRVVETFKVYIAGARRPSIHSCLQKRKFASRYRNCSQMLG